MSAVLFALENLDPLHCLLPRLPEESQQWFLKVFTPAVGPLLLSQNAVKLRDFLITAVEIVFILIILDAFQVTFSSPGSWWEQHLDHCSVQAAALTAADSTLLKRVKKHLKMRERIELA